MVVVESAKSSQIQNQPLEIAALQDINNDLERRAKRASFVCLGSFGVFMCIIAPARVDSTGELLIAACTATYLVSLTTLLRNSNKAQKVAVEIAKLKRDGKVVA